MTEQTKQKLKDALIEHKNIAASEYDDEDAFVGIYFSDLVDIINSVTNNTDWNNSEWIPVEEELPEENQKVLVYMPADERCDHEYMCEALYNYAWHKWEDADEPIELEGVTHWIPRPLLPRKEK